MNTLTIQSRRPIYKAGKPIGANTQNVTCNLHDKAVAILEKVCGPNRSQFIRQAIAREIQRIDTWSGLAFRVACNLANDFKSLFAGTHPEKSVAWEDGLEKFKAEKVNEVPTGGAALIEDLTKVEGGEFEPTK